MERKGKSQLVSISPLSGERNGKCRERLLTVKEAAAYLRLSKSIVYSMIQKRKIPYIKLTEKRIVIRESDLKTWLSERVIGTGDVWYMPGWK